MPQLQSTDVTDINDYSVKCPFGSSEWVNHEGVISLLRGADISLSADSMCGEEMQHTLCAGLAHT